jgi:hypothetical protein
VILLPVIPVLLIIKSLWISIGMLLAWAMIFFGLLVIDKFMNKLMQESL